MTDEANKARRMSYIRWRLKEGKPVTEAQRKELNEHDAKVMGAYAESLDRLSFDDVGILNRLSAADLLELTRDATLVAPDETPTKKVMIERIKTFRELGLRAAKQAA